MNALYKEREWYAKFIQNPVAFVHDVTLSQSYDLKILSSSYQPEFDQETDAELYKESWVPHAVEELWNSTRL